MIFKVVHEIKFMAPPRTGTYKFLVYIVSDSYLGLDSKHQVKMTVIAAAEHRLAGQGHAARRGRLDGPRAH